MTHSGLPGLICFCAPEGLEEERWTAQNSQGGASGCCDAPLFIMAWELLPVKNYYVTLLPLLILSYLTVH